MFTYNLKVVEFQKILEIKKIISHFILNLGAQFKKICVLFG